MTHDRDCATCRDQAPEVSALAPALRSLPVPAGDAARARERLLDAAARLPTRRRSHLVTGGLALAAAVAVVAVVLAKSHEPVATQVFVQGAGATWSRHFARDATLVRLDEGTLELRVVHGAQEHHLVVSVPDGEIDDIGTTFQVEVVHGRTRAVAVREGAVIVRLVGSAPVFLVAGEHWSPPVATAPVPTPVVPPVVSPVAPAPIAAAPVAPRPVARPPHAPSTAGELAAAVRLFDAGDLTAAVEALRGFIVHHPDDPRTEDAYYLLAVALDRSGDHASAAAAARTYLERYPHGFRRGEAESLAARER